MVKYMDLIQDLEAILQNKVDLVSDRNLNKRVRPYVTPDLTTIYEKSNGTISTIAGNGIAGYSGNRAPAILAHFYYSGGLTVGPGGSITFQIPLVTLSQCYSPQRDFPQSAVT